MFRYLLIIGLLLMAATACSPTTTEATEPQPTESEEVSGEEHEQEDDHDEEHDEEHAEDEDYREHGAHEHGAAALTIAWSGNELAIDLETPAFNVLGFEYAPSSEEEIALLDESVAVLEAGEDLFQLSPEAECTFTSADVHAEMSETEHEEGEDEEETHSDIDVAYTVQCQNPDDLESLDASGLFDHFPNFEALQVQWVSDTQQSATELTSDNPVVSFR